MNAAQTLQRNRELADLKNHIERVQWLSKESPKWVDGTPVDSFTAKTLLAQSESAIDKYKLAGLSIGVAA
jgi:hypothetical protein